MLISGEWFRFERYEIADGFIRPMDGAVLEKYDPWTQNQEQSPPPYRSLAELVAKPLAKADEDLIELTPEGTSEVLSWVNCNGLLGILPDQASSVVLAPRWSSEHSTDRPRKKAICQRRFVRHGGHWHELSHGFFTTKADGAEGELVDPEDIPEDWPASGALTNPAALNGEAIGIQPLADSWARFFPGVPKRERETFEYPAPFEENFWRVYAEPVGAFLNVAMMFREAILNIEQWVAAPEASRLPASLVGFNFSLLAAGVSRTIQAMPHGFVNECWESPSLIGTLAMMAIQDLTDGYPRSAIDSRRKPCVGERKIA